MVPVRSKNLKQLIVRIHWLVTANVWLVISVPNTDNIIIIIINRNSIESFLSAAKKNVQDEDHNCTDGLFRSE